MSFSRRRFAHVLGGAMLGPGLRGAGPPLFEEIPASVSGLTWVHENAMSPQRYLPETMGPGCAFLDFDNDGWMDIYLVNSGPADFYKPARPLRNALYKNNRDGTFTDVTLKARVPGAGFGMGVAVGDFDNDGWPDLFVTSYGDSILYKNNRDGTFTDVTKAAGLKMPPWTTSAVWFDYDNDGWLDLFVCSFVLYGPGEPRTCEDLKPGIFHYCPPRVQRPSLSVLYKNNRDGTFSQVKGTDIDRSPGKGLGVVATDVDGDGRMDLFVANDSMANFLYMNRGPAPGGWNFEEVALPAEVAYGENGQPRSGMGVDAADLFGKGRQDLFVANIDQEMFSLYQNLGQERFRDIAREQGIAKATLLLSGWGLRFFDYDNDGTLDLMIANGHPDDHIEERAAGVKYREPLLLFRQDGGRLHDISADAGPAFARSYSARGLATGDFDNDGRLDVLVALSGETPLLLRNRSGDENHWLGLKLQGVRCTRDAIGARITWSADGVVRSRLRNGGGSYLSYHDPREILGIGKATKIDWVEIAWPAPSTKVQRIENPAVDRYITVREE